MAKKLNTDLDKTKKKKINIEDEVELEDLELDEDVVIDEDDLIHPGIVTSKKKKGKKKKNDDDLPIIEELPPEEAEEDITAYQMGNILVDEGNSDEGDTDVHLQINAVKGKKNDDDEDDEEGAVWINDFDGFDAKDPYLDAEKDFDPDNDGFDDE